MKFKRIVDPEQHEPINAEQYEAGMEEGFESRFYDSANTRVTFSKPVNSRCLPTEVPFITVIDGDGVKWKRFLNDDDWIITDDEGRKRICDADDFEAMYVPA